MTLAGIFAFSLFVLLIVADWYNFTKLHPLSALYGCGIARRRASLANFTPSTIPQRFNEKGFLLLPHGAAHWIDEQQLITIRPYYHLFAMRFRTAWPLKGSITVHARSDALELQLTKRIPWSSAIITMLWLGIVVLGTCTFLILFGLDGGFQSAGGTLMALGIGGLGVLVFGFGLIMISLAYRLEDSRLMQVYQELQEALLEKSTTSSSPSTTGVPE